MLHKSCVSGTVGGPLLTHKSCQTVEVGDHASDFCISKGLPEFKYQILSYKYFLIPVYCFLKSDGSGSFGKKKSSLGLIGLKMR